MIPAAVPLACCQLVLPKIDPAFFRREGGQPPIEDVVGQVAGDESAGAG